MRSHWNRTTQLTETKLLTKLVKVNLMKINQTEFESSHCNEKYVFVYILTINSRVNALTTGYAYVLRYCIPFLHYF